MPRDGGKNTFDTIHLGIAFRYSDLSKFTIRHDAIPNATYYPHKTSWTFRADLVGVVNKRERPVLLLDLSRFRGRGNPEDGKGVEPLDLRIVRHRGQQVEEARPSRKQCQHLARPSENKTKFIK